MFGIDMTSFSNNESIFSNDSFGSSIQQTIVTRNRSMWRSKKLNEDLSSKLNIVKNSFSFTFGVKFDCDMSRFLSEFWCLAVLYLPDETRQRENERVKRFFFLNILLLSFRGKTSLQIHFQHNERLDVQSSVGLFNEWTYINVWWMKDRMINNIDSSSFDRWTLTRFSWALNKKAKAEVEGKTPSIGTFSLDRRNH